MELTLEELEKSIRYWRLSKGYPEQVPEVKKKDEKPKNK